MDACLVVRTQLAVRVHKHAAVLWWHLGASSGRQTQQLAVRVHKHAAVLSVSIWGFPLLHHHITGSATELRNMCQALML